MRFDYIVKRRPWIKTYFFLFILLHCSLSSSLCQLPRQIPLHYNICGRPAEWNTKYDIRWYWQRTANLWHTKWNWPRKHWSVSLNFLTFLFSSQFLLVSTHRYDTWLFLTFIFSSRTSITQISLWGVDGELVKTLSMYKARFPYIWVVM